MSDPTYIQLEPEDPPTSGLSKAIGYLAIAIWYVVFQLRSQYLWKIRAQILLLISAIELAGPAMHFISDLHPNRIVAASTSGNALARWLSSHLLRLFNTVHSSGFHLILFVTLTITGIVIFVDHHQIASREKTLRRVMHYLTGISSSRGGSGRLGGDDLPKILTGLVTALNAPNSWRRTARPRLNATVLAPTSPYASAEYREYGIRAQDEHEVFPSDRVVPHEGSVVGKVIDLARESDPDSGLILYVPFTKYAHGLSFKYDFQNGNTDGVVDRVEPVLRAYRDLPEQFEKQQLGCLLCVQIPQDHGCAVLCISSPEENALGDEARTAARLLAKLLWRVSF